MNKLVTKKSLRNRKVLITGGPTWIPIDDVRIISNKSSGQLAHEIVYYLNQEGARITLLEGPVTHQLQSSRAQIIKFCFYDELSALLSQELKKRYDIVIHAAAVSDYQPNHTYGSKLSSEFSQIKLHLVPTVKLIDNIKKLSPRSFLVGFKLESKPDREPLMLKVNNLIKRAHCDLVVANCQNDTQYHGFIIDKERNVLFTGTQRKDVAKNLVKILKERA